MKSQVPVTSCTISRFLKAVHENDVPFENVLNHVFFILSEANLFLMQRPIIKCTIGGHAASRCPMFSVLYSSHVLPVNIARHDWFCFLVSCQVRFLDGKI